MKMSSNLLVFKDVSLKVSPLEDGLFALEFSIATEGGYGKPEDLDVVVDTKNKCVITGKMSNILLRCLKGRRKEDE